jgi:hypothetical protein
LPGSHISFLLAQVFSNSPSSSFSASKREREKPHHHRPQFVGAPSTPALPRQAKATPSTASSPSTSWRKESSWDAQNHHQLHRFFSVSLYLRSFLFRFFVVVTAVPSPQMPDAGDDSGNPLRRRRLLLVPHIDAQLLRQLPRPLARYPVEPVLSWSPAAAISLTSGSPPSPLNSPRPSVSSVVPFPHPHATVLTQEHLLLLAVFAL